MKTAVKMNRPLLGGSITQNSKTEMFSATDLVKVGNLWRIKNGLPPFSMKSWFQSKGTKEFIAELEIKYGVVKKSARGKGTHTWVHPLLFIDMALAISPKIKLETYEWLFDQLIKYRNESGDSYKPMCGALYVNCTNKSKFHDFIRNVAIRIKAACNVSDWNDATEQQLKMRDKIHNDIELLADVLNSNEEAVRIAITKAKGGL